MTTLLLKIKHHCPRIWNCIEHVNGVLVGMRFPGRLEISKRVLKDSSGGDFIYSLIEEREIPKLKEFLCGLSEDTIKYFAPHGFESTNLIKLFNNKGFVLMKVTDKNEPDAIKGYFLLRIFCNGKAFHGLIVGEDIRNRGIGSRMWQIASIICKDLGLKMFATISKNNTPSIKSASNGCSTRIIKELADDYLLIRCEPL